jgi:hypothetical protein
MTKCRHARFSFCLCFLWFLVFALDVSVKVAARSSAQAVAVAVKTVAKQVKGIKQTDDFSDRDLAVFLHSHMLAIMSLLVRRPRLNHAAALCFVAHVPRVLGTCVN